MTNVCTQYCCAVLLPTLGTVCSASWGDDAVSERIYFVQQSGRHAMVYTTSRTDYEDYRIWFRQRTGYQGEDYLKDFLYLFPKSGDWSDDSDPGFVTLKLSNGNFASLEWVALEDQNRLRVDDDGAYHYRNWDGVTKTPDGHFGLWNSPGEFENIAYTWVFPENLEPLSYEANHEGDWVERNNAITYYGNEVNDLVFNVSYRPASGFAYDSMKDLEDDGVIVEQEPTGVRLTLEETLLFPSGVATISASGKQLLDKLAQKLQQQTSLDIVIAGHTDNVPIGPTLVSTFATNWELSSARSLNIIHYLMFRGVADRRFESRAFADVKPADTNETEEGKAKNRRIEIMLTQPGAAGQDGNTLVSQADGGGDAS